MSKMERERERERDRFEPARGDSRMLVPGMGLERARGKEQGARQGTSLIQGMARMSQVRE